MQDRERQDSRVLKPGKDEFVDVNESGKKSRGGEKRDSTLGQNQPCTGQQACN